MDDVFVLIGAWRQTDRSLDVAERLSLTYAHAGTSITITSLTNALSYLTGVFTPFPITRIYCTYSVVSVVLCYLCHITFFGGCMALFGRLEHSGRHSFLLLKATPKSESEHKNILYRIFLTGGRNPKDPEHPLDNQEHLPMTIFRDHVGSFINGTLGKTIIFLSFFVYIGVSIYGLKFVRGGLKERDLFRDSSYASDFLYLHYHHFSRYHMRIQVIIDEPLNYSDEEVQKSIFKLILEMEKGPYIAPSNMTESWLRAFKIFLDNGALWMWYRGLDIRKEEDFIFLLKNVFLKVPASRRFASDIVFNENGTKIIASRFLIQSNDMHDVGHGVETLLHIRKIAGDSPFKTYVFNPMFLFMDHVLLTNDVTLKTMLMAIVIIMIVTFIFIPRIGYAILISFTIFSVELGVLGFMGLWDVILDPISMVCLIMCVGFTVDNTTHILCAFIASPEKEAPKKVQQSLYNVGLPIIQGFLSSVIAIVALILTQTTVFLRTFKIIFLALVFGTLHSLFLLPAMLIIFCKIRNRYFPKCSRKNEDDNEREDPVENIEFRRDDKSHLKYLKDFKSEYDQNEFVQKVTSV